MTGNELKHLDYIQSTITRMAGNQFQIKGWAITLNTAILTLFANSIVGGKGTNPYFMLMAIFPTVLFWIMDSRFLSIERSVRKIYSDVAAQNGKVALFEIPIKQYAGGPCSILRCMVSFSNVLVYLLPCLIFVSVFVYLTLWI